LPNVYLVSGVKIERDPDHGELITIEKLPELFLAIAFLLVAKREDIGPMNVVRAGYTRVAQFNVLVTTDAFEVRGMVELPGKYDPDSLLVENAARFFAMYNVTINAWLKPDIKFSGEAVLINRTRVSAFCGGD